MREFEIEEMHFSSGALREGILYEMDDQLHRSDIRMRTAESLAARHAVEVDHAKHVKETAMSLLQQGIESVSIKKKKELTQLLGWSALLHEVGLSIHHQGYHKHSAYLLRHSYMPGFNNEQQLLLSVLARFHRKSLKLQELPSFYLYREQDIIFLIRTLRLAVLLNHSRDDYREVKLSVSESMWHIEFEEDIKRSEVLKADIENEHQFLSKHDWGLTSNLT